MSLTVRGDVMLCCATFDQKEFGLGSYLGADLEELQKRKNAHSFCGTCIKAGANSLYLYQPEMELNRIAERNVAKHFPHNRHRRDPLGPDTHLGKIARTVWRAARAPFQ